MDSPWRPLVSDSLLVWGWGRLISEREKAADKGWGGWVVGMVGMLLIFFSFSFFSFSLFFLSVSNLG